MIFLLHFLFIYKFQYIFYLSFFFFFSSRRRHTRWPRDWSSDVCSSDLPARSAIVVIGSSVACWAIARSGFSADIVVLQEGSRGRSQSTGTMRGDGREEGGAKRRREDEASPATRVPTAPGHEPARSGVVRERAR